MSAGTFLMRRVVEPAVIRWYQWRGDALAQWMRPESKADPYPMYEQLRRADLVRSGLGAWVTVSHATAEAILRDRRFSPSPTHLRRYRPPSYPPGDPRGDPPPAGPPPPGPPAHT